MANKEIYEQVTKKKQQDIKYEEPRSFFSLKEEPNIPRVTLEKTQRTERIKRLGNAVVPLQARIAFKSLMGY